MINLNPHKIAIQRGNSKLGKVLNISLPPGVSCRIDAPCYDACYAKKFAVLRKACRDSWARNWNAACNHRNDYFKYIHVTVAHAKPALFRWHVAGDIPDTNYLVNMISLARACPDTKFLCFTKQYELIEPRRMSRRIDATENLSVVVSMWPELCVPEPLACFPKAWMLDPKSPDPRIPNDANNCDGGCDTCGLCWGLKKGESVVFNKH